MNPAFLDGMSWEMAEVYGAISDQILINLAKYFPYYKPGATVPKSAFTYQSMMLAQFGQVNAETVAIIRRGLKDANSALNGVLEQAIIDSVRTAEKPLYKAVKQGIFSPPLVPIVSPNQTRAFQLYYAQACDKLNLVNTVMLESTGSAYRQAVNDVVSEMQINDRIKKTQTALDIGTGETVSGVSSWNQALRHTVERMKATGITGFVDHAGRHWSAEAYAAMDIRTTVWNTSRAAVWETNQNFGNDLYSVSFHNGARPGCYDWQNRVISSTNNARTVTDLDGNEIYVVAQSDTSYGQAAGLFGVNCKHYPTPFIPGVSIIRGQPQSPEENERTYEESQEQRRLERKLREEKRDIMMAKAQGASDEEIKALQARARNTSQDIDDFCESTGRTRHRDREGVYTQRSFPSKDSYDVSAFETEQRDKQKQFFENGGAQRQYQSGVLDGNATNTQTPQETQSTEQPAEQPKTEEPKPGDIIDDFDIFDLMSNYDTDADVPIAEPEESWQRSEKYGDFGLTNASYPKNLQYTEGEQKQVDYIIGVIDGKNNGKEMSSDVYEALVPVRGRTDELKQSNLDWKEERIAQRREAEQKRLAEAEQMIEQRKAEGYTGRSKAESFMRWKALKEELEGADEFEAGDILAQNRVGESGIRYWQQQRKSAKDNLQNLDFAEKIIKRQRHAFDFLKNHR